MTTDHAAFLPPSRRAPTVPTRWPHWVPVRSLGQAHRKRIHAHLLSLPSADRYLRFGYVASDEQIGRYVDSIDFQRDEVFGIFNRQLTLIAVAHLAFGRPAQCLDRPAMVEFGVSVVPRARGRGFGTRLFEHAVMRARNHGCQTLFIHALSENAAMLKIARHAGATVERQGSDASAWLNLPRDTFASQAEGALESQVGEFDFQFKRRMHHLRRWIGAVGEIRTQLMRLTGLHAVHREE